MLMQRLGSSAARTSAFARVTSLAAAVVAATALSDVLTGEINISMVWTTLMLVLAAVISVMPLLLGRRLHAMVGLVGCWLFLCVTSLQVMVSEDELMAVNNLVLYPMISCYLGWFFTPMVARITVGAHFVASFGALIALGHIDVFRTWANLALASFFCLEAALYLRTRLDQQIESDPLTGAFNRAGLHAHLSREMSRSDRTGHRLTMAVIDLDNFKGINDKFGHPAGDQTLIDLVAHLRSSLRPHDMIARIGGDEFVVLLPDTTRNQASNIMRRLQASSSMRWSFGVASALPSDTQESLMRRADEDLYINKRRAAER